MDTGHLVVCTTCRKPLDKAPEGTYPGLPQPHYTHRTAAEIFACADGGQPMEYLNAVHDTKGRQVALWFVDTEDGQPYLRIEVDGKPVAELDAQDAKNFGEILDEGGDYTELRDLERIAADDSE